MTKTLRYLDSIHTLIEILENKAAKNEAPLIIALDGKSGSGKSTIADALHRHLDSAKLPLDDFFSATIPDREWDAFSIEERRSRVFEWDRFIHECLEPLRKGRTATWRAFDFESGPEQDGTYRLESEEKRLDTAPIVLVDGAYSSAPELLEYIDVTVLVKAPKDERLDRLKKRDGVGLLDQHQQVCKQRASQEVGVR
jgi:para-aminobenzoate synthetase